MPTILIIYSYRFFFYSNDHDPAHVHVEKNDKTAKFNLQPVELVISRKFNASELRELRKLVEEYSDFFKTKWHEHFNHQ